MATLLIANWKMAVSVRDSVTMAKKIATWKKSAGVELVVAPSFVSLASVAAVLKKKVGLATQDISAFVAGAHTGDVDAADATALGCSYALVGHSERRQFLGETNELVAAKVAQAWGTGLTPVLCIGETAAQRKAGKWKPFLTKQIIESLPAHSAGKLVIAYEPVWAIGTGNVVTPKDLAEAVVVILAAITKLYCRHAHEEAEHCAICARVRVLYGGSVHEKNIASLAEVKGVDGFLVGGASQTSGSLKALIYAL